MKTTTKQYDEMVKAASPNSPKAKNFFFAFLVGGLICTFAQLLLNSFLMVGISEESAKMTVPVTLIFLTALFTGLRLFDKLAKVAGAGTLVPITGFANAMVSPAIEFKNEGFVLGVGANLFKIAGPVIVYGTAASALYGVIYWMIKVFF